MHLQTVWSLNSISDSLLEVTRGVLRAATSDNVQPLAILACERFGNTIAMSPETCQKIERVVLPTPQPAPINFLRGVVGYSANDCASQLGQSLAGIQFLGLAAALVTTTGPFAGGKALELMLRQSAADKTLLPTARQLKDLLASLEPRCHAAGFAETVVGWHLLLCQTPETEAQRKYLKVSNYVPSATCIDKVVDAFRQLERIGEVGIVKVTIKSNGSSSWLAAFTKWCLRLSPSVYLDDGTPIIEQPGSIVDIIAYTGSDDIETDDSKNFEITIHHSLGSIVTLTHPNLLDLSWTGMVSIGFYGKLKLQEYGLDKGIAKRALDQALPYAITEVLTKLKFSNYPLFTEKNSINNWRHICSSPDQPNIDAEFQELGLSPFPGSLALIRILCLYLDTTDRLDRLQTLDKGLLIADLPVVALFIASLQKMCTCHECDADSRGPKFRPCQKELFIRHIAFIVADVFALSLYQLPESILVEVKHVENIGGKYGFFGDTIYEILTNGNSDQASLRDLQDLALSLLGHVKRTDKEGRTIVASSKGQVVYPTIFETFQVEKSGYMSLSWLRGVLRFNGEEYPRVTSQLGMTGGLDPVRNLKSMFVKEPCNLVENYKMVWKIIVEDGFLDGCMGIDSPAGDMSHVTHSPQLIWDNLAGALILESCPHDPGAPLDSAEKFCEYTGPIDPTAWDTERGYSLGVVAVDKADDLRLLTLAALEGPIPIVIRKKACLRCCIDVCRKTNYPILIL